MRTLGGQRLWPQREGVVEACPEQTRCLLVFSAARMVGCRAAAKRQGFSGFRPGRLIFDELHIINLVGFVEERCWLGYCIDIFF